MKRSAKVMSFVMAPSVTTAMVPQASAQKPPAATPAQQQTQAQQKQNTHSRAKGAAAGAAVGAVAGNADKGAAVGAVVGGTQNRQTRRQERRGNSAASDSSAKRVSPSPRIAPNMFQIYEVAPGTIVGLLGSIELGRRELFLY